ncbi:MAG: hypothetical protein K9W44_00380 [Candidatus Lokiarchaeota archaeon]|nr:hypothetical protein [Candidatus Harpocratesius repetitus]
MKNDSKKQKYGKIVALGLILLIPLTIMQQNHLFKSDLSLNSTNNIIAADISQNYSFAYPFYCKTNFTLSNSSTLQLLGTIQYDISGFFHFEPGDEFIINSTAKYQRTLTFSGEKLIQWDNFTLYNSTSYDSSYRIYQLDFIGNILFHLTSPLVNLSIEWILQIFDNQLPDFSTSIIGVDFNQYKLEIKTTFKQNCDQYFTSFSDDNDTSSLRNQSMYIIYATIGICGLLGTSFFILRKKLA